MRRTGFTLIELLVVISIVSLLSSVVASSLQAARGKARDSTRLETLASLRNAIQLYVTDNAGFPAGVGCLGVATGNKCWNGYALNAGGTGVPGNSTLNAALAPYMSALPADPNPARTVGDAYIYFKGGADVHCNGTDTVQNSAWLAWQPEAIDPHSDAACAPGKYACCSGLGCGSHYFCVLELR